MNKLTSIAITHNGFEGAAATAVLLEKFPEAELCISSARKIAQTLSELSPKKTRQVFLVGIGARDCPPEDVVAALKPFLEAKVSVTWFYLWDDLDWLPSELGAHPYFALIKGSGESLPRLVAEHLECRSRRTKAILELTEGNGGPGGEKDLLVRLVEAAALRYLKFGDREAFPEAVRKLADPSRITQADREAAMLLSRFGDRVLLGKSPSMKRLRDLITKIGGDPSCRVLILGETGTGKELVARHIHECSPRKDKPFVAVSCANIGEHLLESELFGHEKGAFTGAMSQKKGKFELAQSGTLFLDEIGELDLSLQARLLRVLQEGTFYRVGGTEEIRVDVRVIAATNRDLREEVRARRFREDLFYRLNDVPIKTPPLREIPEDIPWIAKDILYRLAAERGADSPRPTPRQIQALQRYHWPGNVRQLESILRRAFILNEWDLGKLLEEEETLLSREVSSGVLPLAEQECRYIHRVYQEMGRNKTKTAEALGISINTLKKKLKEPVT